MSKDGILYVATGRAQLTEGILSAESVKQTNPGLDVSIVTKPELVEEASSEPCFDKVIEADYIQDDVRDKAFNLHLSPYDKTLYLDNDTTVLADISEIFELLDRFDIALSHDLYRLTVSIDGIPESFPEFNGGVILFHKDTQEEFLQAWRSKYESQIEYGRPDETVYLEKEADCLSELGHFGRKHDQPPLREAIFDSDLCYATLPREYNSGKTAFVYAGRNVKILHENHDNRSRQIEEHINKKTVPRVLIKQTRKIYHVDGSQTNLGLPFHQWVTHPIIKSVLKKSGIFSYVKNIYRSMIGLLR